MTSQIPDVLILDEAPLRLFSTPLQPWLAQQRIDLRSGRLNSNCWRGYRATWQIGLGRLILLAVEPWGAPPEAWHGTRDIRARISLEGLFPGSERPVHAIWFSGRLRCPVGAVVEQHFIGFASQFEEELLFNVEQGQVRNVRTWRHFEPEMAA